MICPSTKPLSGKLLVKNHSGPLYRHSGMAYIHVLSSDAAAAAAAADDDDNDDNDDFSMRTRVLKPCHGSFAYFVTLRHTRGRMSRKCRRNENSLYNPGYSKCILKILTAFWVHSKYSGPFLWPARMFLSC